MSSRSRFDASTAASQEAARDVLQDYMTVPSNVAYAEKFAAARVDGKALEKHGELLLGLFALQKNVSSLSSNSTVWRFSHENEIRLSVSLGASVSRACISLERRASLASRCVTRTLFVEETHKAPSRGGLPDISTARKCSQATRSWILKEKKRRSWKAKTN